MRIGQLSEHFFVAGRIEPEHVPKLAEFGIKTLVNNRPDGEEWGQPTSDEIAAVAAEHGIEYLHIPVAHAGISMENIEDFKKRCADFEAPILMFCRSGARSSMLFQMCRPE